MHVWVENYKKVHVFMSVQNMHQHKFQGGQGIFAGILGGLVCTWAFPPIDFLYPRQLPASEEAGPYFQMGST